MFNKQWWKTGQPQRKMNPLLYPSLTHAPDQVAHESILVSGFFWAAAGNGYIPSGCIPPWHVSHSPTVLKHKQSASARCSLHVWMRSSGDGDSARPPHPTLTLGNRLLLPQTLFILLVLQLLTIRPVIWASSLPWTTPPPPFPALVPYASCV